VVHLHLCPTFNTRADATLIPSFPPHKDIPIDWMGAAGPSEAAPQAGHTTFWVNWSPNTRST